MKRHLLAAAVALAVGIGLVDPYACVQYSSGGSLKREAPARERARVLAAARRAITLLPAPRGYRFDHATLTSEADRTAPWDDARGGWSAPVAARAERVYEPPNADSDDAPPPFEQRVFVNAEVALPSGLASEGSAPRAFAVPGAAAALVVTAGTEEPRHGTGGRPAGGRVALPVPPGKAAAAPAIVRVVVADPALEQAFRDAVASGGLARPRRAPPARVGAVESVVIELYGGRRDVEAAARRVPVAALRGLLDR